jgi:hypothetical protein
MSAGTSTRVRIPLQDRLLNKAARDPETGCWLFKGCTIGTSGYGQIGDGAGKLLLAHRASYALFCGPIPSGMMVLHKCDVRTCINPTHLFLGTGKDNMRDAKAKNRHQAGERHAFAKLTAREVRDIRARLAAGQHYIEVAEVFGIAPATVRDIRAGRRWASLLT